MTVTFKTQLSFPGGEIEYVDNDHLVYILGNGLAVLDVASKTSEFLVNIPDCRLGISAFTTNIQKKLIAIAPRSTKPSIHVFNFPLKGSKTVLEHGTDLEYETLAMSQNAEVLCGISGPFDHHIYLWSISKAEIISSVQVNIRKETPFNLHFCSFNPRNISMICTAGSHGLIFWKVEAVVSDHQIRRTDAVQSLDPTPENEMLMTGSGDYEEEKYGKVSEGPSRTKKLRLVNSFNAQCWIENDLVIAVNYANKLMEFDAHSGRLVRQLHLPGVMEGSCCISIAILREHTLLTFSDGAIFWINTNKFDSIELIVTTARAPGIRFSSCSLTPSCDQLLIAATGRISLLPLNDPEEPDYKLSRTMQSLTVYHDGLVLAMASQSVLKNETCPVLVTAGIDGSLMVWNDSGTVIGNHTFWQSVEGNERPVLDTQVANSTQAPVVSITSLAAAPFDPLVVLGTYVGSLHLLYLLGENGEPNSIELISLGNLHLSHRAISSILFHPENDLVATACEAGIYIIDVSLQKSSNPLMLLAHSAFKDGPASLCLLWFGNNLLVAFVDGTISNFCLSNDGEFHDYSLRLLTKIWTRGVEMPLTDMSILKSWSSGTETNSFLCGVSPSSCHIVIVSLPIILDADANLVTSTIESSHERGIVCLKQSPCGNFMATGDADGRIILWKILANMGLLEMASMNLHVGSILCVEFSRDISMLYSTGIDGAIFSLNIPVLHPCRLSSPRTKFQHLAEKIQHIPIRAIPAFQLTWHESHEKRMRESAMLEAEAHKAVQRNVLADLRRRLHELLAKNEISSSIEKMSREDFVVDVAGREKLLAASRLRAKELEHKLKEEDKARNAVSSRIRFDCWDSMEVQATECRAFQRTNVLVSSFPLKHRSVEELRRTDCIRILRKLELRDISLSGALNTTWPRNSNIIPQEIAWIFNQGELRPVLDVTEKSNINDISTPMQESNRPDLNNSVIASITSKKSNESPEDEEEEDGDVRIREEEALDVDSLITQLYPPLTLNTPIQKRTQQILLHQLINQVQVNFNTRFSALYDDKRNEADRICEKNTRIHDILSELNSKEDYFRPTFDEPDETPEVVIMVKDSEINCTPPETGAARSIRQKAEDQRERMSGSCDNAGERALQDMMYGTLETKKDADLFQTELKPPSWIDEVETTDLTDAQRREIDEYNIAKAILEEHQEKYRKALELEFKKLRTEVCDITRNFDDRVKHLADQRVLVMNSVMTQELYLIRIGAGMLERENDVFAFSRMNLRKVALEKENISLEQLVRTTSDLADAATEKLDTLQSEDKLLERNFKRDMQLEHQIDQDNFKIVLSYYRDRSALGGMVSESTSGFPQDISMPNAPDNFKLDENTWSTLRTLRNKKIVKEEMLSSATANQNRLKSKYDESLGMLNTNSADINELEVQQASMQAKLEVSENNTEVLIRVRQGQDELEQEAVVTEYCDAVLLPVETISIINKEIRRLGTEQVKILHKIKHFRKSINFMEWENRYMKEQSHDLEEYYTDLQLLHVTKNLQSVMKGDQSNCERERMAKADARVSMMNRVHEKKCSKFANINSKLVQQIRAREEENERLSQQLSEIGDAVSVREAIVRSRLDNSTGEVNSERRTTNNMKRITLRRRLIDLVRYPTNVIYPFIHIYITGPASNRGNRLLKTRA